MPGKTPVVLELLLNDTRFKTALKDAVAESGKLERAVQKASNPFKGMSDHASALSGRLVSIGGVLGGLVTAAAGFGAALVFKDSIESSISQENALNDVAFAMKRTGEFSQVAFADVQTFAAKLQDLTGIGDQTSLSMFSLAKSFGANNQVAKNLVTAATELSAATGKSLEESIRQVSKTLGGFAGELGEVNPAIKALTQEQLKAGKAADILIEQYGGTAANKLKTFAGAVEAAKGRITNFQEEIGSLVTENPVVVEAINGLGGVFKDLGQFVKDNSGELNAFVGSAVQGLVDTLPDAIASISAMVEGFAILVGANPFDDLEDSAKGMNSALREGSSLIVDVADLSLQLQGTLKRLAQGLAQLGTLGNVNSDWVQASEAEVYRLQRDIEAIEKARQKLADRTVEVVYADGSEAAKRAGNNFTDNLLKSLRTRLADVAKTAHQAATAGAQASTGGGRGVAGGTGGNPYTHTGDARSMTVPDLRPGAEASVNVNQSFDGLVNDIADSVKNGFVVGTDGFLRGFASNFAQNVFGGEEGARKLLGAASGAAADAIVPGLGQAIGPLVEGLSQGPEYVKAQVEEFAKAFPILIDNIVDAIPVFVETLADHADEIIVALVEGGPRISAAIITSLSNPNLWIGVAAALLQSFAGGVNYQVGKLNEGITQFQEGAHQAGANFAEYFKTEFPAAFKDGLSKIGDGFDDAIGRPLENAAQNFTDSVSSAGTNFLASIEEAARKLADNANPAKAISGESGKSTGKRIIKAIATGGASEVEGVLAATGGIVRGPGNRDTVPAMLSPGELVIDRTTGPKLMSFLDGQMSTASRKDSAGSADVVTMLGAILAAVQRPTQVQTSIEIDGRVLADAILDLSMRNARTAA